MQKKKPETFEVLFVAAIKKMRAAKLNLQSVQINCEKNLKKNIILYTIKSKTSCEFMFIFYYFILFNKN